jgi:alpha-galactosidase
MILSRSQLLTCLLSLGAATAVSGEEFPLSKLNLSGIEQGWGEPHANRSVERKPLTIAGRKFESGIGTHAESTFPVELDAKALTLSGWVGVDDETEGKGSVVFRVEGDGKELWNSGILRANEAAKEMKVDVAGVKSLLLHVTDAGDGLDYDHADWADLKVDMKEGKPHVPQPPAEEAVILTPTESASPRINSTKSFGVRPGSPFLYTVAATGARPMTFGASGLPKGLQLDAATGQITGRIEKPGKFKVTLTAKNSLGKARRALTITCGSQIGLTPAMGWNSWNCFAHAVTAEKVKAAADAMVSSGLINHGWTYINIDDFWEVHRDSKDVTLQGPQRDAQGNILPNPRFPDMKGLTDYVHAKGLRIGLYSSPGPWTCGGCVASFDHEVLDARMYAAWGFDYLKYDWCSYNPGLEQRRGNAAAVAASTKSWSGSTPKAQADLMRPYAIMFDALKKQPRDILFSLCQYGMGDVWNWGALVGGNSWRTTGDIVDTWSSLSHIGFSQTNQWVGAGPGHYNDPDMLIVGKVGWGPSLHPTRLTPNEQYTHISLWCLLASPLLIGCDMTQLDPFTLSLLSNDEVLEVDQDPLGKQATRVAKHGNLEVWAKEMSDGSKAIGLFNRGNAETTVTANWSDLGLKGNCKVRDLWRQQDLGKFKDQFQAKVARHGVVLIKVSK